MAVEPKVMEVLVCLASQPGRTVSKDFFFEHVWDGIVVTEDVLSRCISELRKNLGDDSRNPHYIETIRKSGYRLLAPVTVREPGAAPDQRRRQPPNELVSGRDADSEHAGVQTAVGETQSLLTRGQIVFGIALILLFGAYLILTNLPSPEPESEVPPVTTPFTSLPGLEIDPAFSPDGKKIAFASDDNGQRNFDIYIKQEGSDKPLRLTENDADERYPSWSPDGLFLAFVRIGGGSNAVYTIPSLGGQERKVVDFGGRRVQGVSWSPDGTRLAVSAQREPFGAFSIFLVGVDSARVRRVTAPPRFDLGDLDPAFSPDGKSLAFSRGLSEDVQDLFVYQLEEDDLRQLTFDSAAVSGLDWMPDAASIVFASRREHGSGLWRVSTAGGEPQSLAIADPGATYEQPSVARDGARLTYVHRSASVNIWRLFKPEGFPSLRARPAIFSTHWDSHPDISPDGEHIAFASTQSGHREIWVAEADGKNPVQLTTVRGRAKAPKWSPDGTELAFQLRKNGQADVYIIDAQGGAPRQLTSSPYEDTVPVWSRDGTAVYFSSNRSGRPEIWRIRKSEGRAEQVTRYGGRYCMEGDDGSELYFVRPDTNGIWTRPLDSEGEPTMVYEDLDPRDWSNWSVASAGIYFVQRLPHAPALSFFGFQSKRTTRIQTLDDVPAHPALSVAKDLSWFVYTQIDDEGSDIMILENFQ